MQIIKNKTITLFCAVFMLCSLKMFSADPVWITTPAKAYPTEKFLTGLGNGDTQEKAEIAAIESLASIFGQDIKSSSVSSKKMAQVRGDIKAYTGSSSQFSEEIQRSVSVEDLIGVKIVERASSGGKFYALAAMDKQEATTILVSTITNNNTRIDSLLNYDKDDEFSFSTYAQLDLARSLATVNDKLLKKLDVINPQKAAALKPKCKTAISIKKKMNEISKQIPIYIGVDGDYDNQVKQALSKMVTSSGFKTSDNSDERYCIVGNVTLTERKPKDGKTVQCMYTFEALFSDTLIEENLMPINIQGREGSSDSNDAKVRAFRAIGAKINTTVTSSFLNFLNSL